MFFSHTILARKSPLGTVWIAAHFEKRLKKPQIDKIDISTYAEFIMFPQAPIALRLSGQLLFGLVRIYELKVHYAFKDCQKLETDIKSTITSLKLNLPPDADRFAHESITLPSTFQLDTIDLHDSEFNLDENNIHQKTFDEITITDDFLVSQEKYVSVLVDESEKSNSSNLLEFSNQGFGPMDEDTLPPFEGEMEERISPVKNTTQIEIENLNSNQPEIIPEKTRQIENEILNSNSNHNFFQDNSERIQQAEVISGENNNSNSAGPMDEERNGGKNLSRENTTQIEIENLNLNQPEIIPEKPRQIDNEILNSNSNPNFFQDNSEQIQQLELISGGYNNSPINGNRRESSSPVQAEQLEISSEEKLRANVNSPIFASPRVNDAPSSGPQAELELQIRVAPPVKERKNKRRKEDLIYDEHIVLSNEEMKKQLNDTSKLVCKRRKLPDNSFDNYRLKLHRLKDGIFFQPLITGMCSSLTETMERILPQTNNHPVGPTVVASQSEDVTPGSMGTVRLEPTPQIETNKNVPKKSPSPVIQYEVDSPIHNNREVEMEILPIASSPVWQFDNVTPGSMGTVRSELAPQIETNKNQPEKSPSPVIQNKVDSPINNNRGVEMEIFPIASSPVGQSDNVTPGSMGTIRSEPTPGSMGTVRSEPSPQIDTSRNQPEKSPPVIQNEVDFPINNNRGVEVEMLPIDTASCPAGQSENATPGRDMEVELDLVQEIDETYFAFPASPVKNQLHTPLSNNNNDDDDNNNNNNNNNDDDDNSNNIKRGLNFLETPESVKAKRARVEEEAEKRGENLSFVDIEQTEETCWSARSMGMARFLRNLTPNSENNSQLINLNEILENGSRKESARMFFETLVLTTCDYINVKQEKPYGDILITPKPKLATAIKD